MVARPGKISMHPFTQPAIRQVSPAMFRGPDQVQLYLSEGLRHVSSPKTCGTITIVAGCTGFHVSKAAMQLNGELTPM